MSVKAPPDVAWRVFTEKMGTWWPLATYKIGQAKAVDAVIEPRVGGRWYERGDDGSTCDWGRVLVWEPHARLVLSWEISADWKPEPHLKTEVEVHFMADGKNTRVELEHRRLDLYGARRDEMRAASSTAKAAGVGCSRRSPSLLRRREKRQVGFHPGAQSGGDVVLRPSPAARRALRAFAKWSRCPPGQAVRQEHARPVVTGAPDLVPMAE